MVNWPECSYYQDVLTIRAMSGGAGYAGRHLEQNDYYAEGERVKGRWCGKGAELLGLEGEVRQEQFEAIRQGCHPETGEFLRQRHSANRIAQDGTTQSHGRNLYDFTISAPKSVSIMAMVGGDERLIEAHDRAVEAAVDETESYAASRVRLSGANDNRITGNLVAAAYRHDSSRELDPQLHTHLAVANLTFDGTEDRWKAFQAGEIYTRRAYLTEVYRNQLAHHVRELGYEIENRRDGRGRDAGFEIRGVSPELIERFSQRSQQRDQAIARFREENGRVPTDNEVAVLIRETRADKLQEISTPEVRERQQSRLTEEESHSLSQLREQVLDVSRGQQHRLRYSPATESLHYARDHVFERVSVTHDYELLTEALRHGRGQIGLKELRGTMRMEEMDGALLRHGTEVATHEALQREREMIRSVDNGVGKYPRLGGTQQFQVSERLRTEQRQAVAFVLDSRDLAVNIQGAAGTGKTAMLEELHRGVRESGREVLAVAPTMSAVEELRKVGFQDASTVERLLQDQQLHAKLRGRVLVVDEAGMVSGRQMAELIHLAEKQSARIVFAGDTRQIHSVEASDALRILERESNLANISLTQVQRQKANAYREAIEELRRNPARGFARLESMDAVREVAYSDRAQAVASAYAQAQSRNAAGKLRSVLVVCATHEEIAEVTQAIREDRKRTGGLGVSVRLNRHVPLNWTDAQKRDTRNYQAGQVLEFHRAVKGIAKNEAVEVVRVEQSGVVARDERGGEHLLAPTQAKAFGVFENRPIEVATNDRLLLMANRREPGFRATNGELVTAKGIDSKGRIELEDGRRLPANYRQFTHGYAITAHRSQGKTVDAVVISADEMKKELFYVAVSRGREEVTVVTTDKERLAESICRSDHRKSATELAHQSAIGIRQAYGSEDTRQKGASEKQSIENDIPGHQMRPNQTISDTRKQQLDHTNGIGYGM